MAEAAHTSIVSMPNGAPATAAPSTPATTSVEGVVNSEKESKPCQAGRKRSRSETEAGQSSCCVCGATAPRYRCPRCEQRTCSVGCVRAHKTESGCDGKRDRTAYISIASFSDRQFSSDFYFLEEVAATVRGSRRDPRTAASGRPRKSEKRLAKQARRSGVSLRRMPLGMQRRKLNRTVWDSGRKRLLWTVELIFGTFDKDTPDVKILAQRVDDESDWKCLLNKVAGDRADTATQVKLKRYRECIDQLRVFIRCAESPANKPTFYSVSSDQTVRDSLKGITVVEFPTVHVALPQFADLFSIARRPEVKSAPVRKPPDSKPDASSAVAAPPPVPPMAKSEVGVNPYAEFLSSAPPPS